MIFAGSAVSGFATVFPSFGMTPTSIMGTPRGAGRASHSLGGDNPAALRTSSCSSPSGTLALQFLAQPVRGVEDVIRIEGDEVHVPRGLAALGELAQINRPVGLQSRLHPCLQEPLASMVRHNGDYPLVALERRRKP